MAVSIAVASSLHAEVWGYIDDKGRSHLASEKLDERYQLFFKGKTQHEIATEAAAKAAPRRDEAFVRTPIFRRLEADPNVARYEPIIVRHAKANGLDVALVKAVVAVESAYEAAAVSHKGAVGLMQVIPETAERYGISDDAKRTVEQKLLDPAVNIGVGTRYLKDLLALFSGDLELTLAAYNAGEGAVARYGNKVPPFPETQEYVKLVRQFHDLYKPPPPPPPRPARITIPRRPVSPP